MRLLLVTPEFDPNRGGIGRYLSDLYSNLPQDKVRVVVRPDVWQPHWLWALPRVWRELRQEPDTVLHVSHILPLGTVAWLLHLLLGTKYILSLHGMDFALASTGGRKTWLAKRILRNAALVTVNSEALRGQVREFCGKDAVIIYPMFSMAHGEVAKRPETARELVIVTVTRLVERKGVDTLLRALALLPEFRLVVCGDGPDRSRLEALVAELGVTERVRFFGWANDAEKEQLYRSAQVFALPVREIGADREGFGIVYLEAQYFGLPVVAGEGIGVREALHPELRQFAVSHTPETLAHAIRTAVTYPPQTAKLQAFARNFAPGPIAERFWKAAKRACI